MPSVKEAEVGAAMPSSFCEVSTTDTSGPGDAVLCAIPLPRSRAPPKAVVLFNIEWSSAGVTFKDPTDTDDNPGWILLSDFLH